MKKKVNERKISKELIVLGIFLFSISFLILFGWRLTGFAVFEDSGNDFNGTGLGEYQGEIEINRSEINKSQDIKIIVKSTSERIMIKEIKPEKQSLNISYFFDHSDIIGKEVSVEIWVTDEQNEKKIEVLRHTDSFSINKEGLIERNLLIELPENLVGIYYVYLALSSELDRYVMQTVVIGKSAATGLVGFDTTRGKIIGYIIFVIIIIAGVLFIIRRNIKISQTKSKKIKSFK